MDFTIIGLIILCIGGIIFLLATSSTKNRVKNNKKDIDETVKNGEIRRKNDSDIPRKDIINFMEFEKILDNMIIQDKGEKYTMVVQCKGINYDLMSQVEQLAVEEGFITFLNTLKFPIQLYVQARAIDLKKSIDSYQPNLDDLVSQYDAAEDNLKTISTSINASYEELRDAKIEREKFANIVEYAEDITRYVERISLNKHVLQRKFYIIFSYYKSEITTTNEFTEQELHELCYRELYTRAQTIISALMSCSVTGRVLTSNELAELLYISYNRDDEKLLDIKTALESGFYRLYSTSEDLFDKKQKLMQKEVDEEAARRVQAAINELIDADTIKTEDELREEFEERADMRAINLVREIGIDDEIKEKLSEHIATNHVIEAEKRRQERIMREERATSRDNVVVDQDEENSTKLDGNDIEDQSILENNLNKAENPNNFIKRAGRSDLKISDDILTDNINILEKPEKSNVTSQNVNTVQNISKENVVNTKVQAGAIPVTNSTTVQAKIEPTIEKSQPTTSVQPSVASNASTSKITEQNINKVQNVDKESVVKQNNVVNTTTQTKVEPVVTKPQPTANVQESASNNVSTTNTTQNVNSVKKDFPEPLVKIQKTEENKESKDKSEEKDNEKSVPKNTKSVLDGANDSIV